MKGKFIYLFWLALLVPSLAYSNIFDQSNPARWVCGSDLNGNGYLGEEGETAACIGNAPSNYCPIGASVCRSETDIEVASPICGSGSILQNGVCSLPATCPNGGTPNSSGNCTAEINECFLEKPTTAFFGTKWIMNTINGCNMYYLNDVGFYSCIHGTTYNGWFRGALRNHAGDIAIYELCRKKWVETPASCPAGTSLNPATKLCERTPSCPAGYNFNVHNKRCERVVSKDVCPLGSQYQCVPNGGAKYCSPNKCVDKEDPANEEAKDVDGNMLVDDGERNDQGLCLDQVYIYNGRGQRCLKSGIETAFQNCCKDKGKVFQDGAGAYSSIGTASQTISGLYSVAEMAYVTYSAQTAAGVSSAFAAELAASAAQQQLLIAFDPTTIAISVAMHYVMEWVMNACDQMDMETAMAHSSGYCVEVGEYCKKKIKFIGCVQKARSFCCFNSELARIIQEQGRPQLTTVNGFGTPSEPNCRGFTPEEFQRIDFAKIDFGEYIEELQKHTQEQVQQDIQQVTEDFFNKVK